MKYILMTSLLIIAAATAPGQRRDAGDKSSEATDAARAESDERSVRPFTRDVYGGIHPPGGGGRMVLDGAARRPDDAGVLLRMEREWNEALKARDVAWFERNLASDLTDVNSGSGALRSKAEDIEALKADRTVYESLELSDLKARVEGGAGVVTGVNHIRGRDEQGQPFDVRLSFTDTYIRRGGRWQVWASQHTRVRP